MRLERTLILSLIVFTGIAAAATEARAQSSRNARVARAERFLDTEDRSKSILRLMHLGGTYKGHEILGSVRVVDKEGDAIPGHFAIRIVYDWSIPLGDNSTTAVFLFDEMGTLYDIQAKSTSIVNQPFDLAGATLTMIGEVILRANGDQMTPEDRRELQKLVDGSDARALLIWSLNFQQKVGS